MAGEVEALERRPTSAGSAMDERDVDELEEGEITPDDSRPTSAGSAAPPQPHPLENSWTFWFDNPSAKSKQATWGSFIRPIHTFSTVEDFWGLVDRGMDGISLLALPDCVWGSKGKSSMFRLPTTSS